MSKDRENIPRANMLMGSMRSMGYSFESAVADVIDNSISANCKNVILFFPLKSYDTLAVGILDDGKGMSSDELFEAMRYGSGSKEERQETDLGRFGLGMKSASMSQCRILTVVSKQVGSVHAFRWDYNYILEKKAWILQELNKDEVASTPYVENLLESSNDGTLVVWQDFDVLEKSSDGQIYDALIELQNKTSDYLSLIYHRFLDDKSIKIKINNHSLKPRDPFLEKN